MRYVCPQCGEPGEHPGACTRDGTRRLEAPADEPLLGTTIGSWRVARLLGAGGMGRVYQAVQPEIGARVAIKVLRPEAVRDRETVERFFSEARAVNVIRHENIVNVLDMARLPSGEPYIVMEHLEGCSLREAIQRRGPLPLGTLGRLIGEVLGALEAAHKKGIIHRDLKSDNVFVTPGGHAKVLDFGIAKLQRQGDLAGPTRTGALLGTPAYMSPEQAKAQPVDARTDLYSTGVILYEGATGTLPFGGPSLFEILQQHVAEAPPPPSRLRPDLPPALEALISKALAKQPDDRYAGAREMAAALAEATSGLPPSAFASLGLSSAPVIAQPPPPDAPPRDAVLAPTRAVPPPASRTPAAAPTMLRLSRTALVSLVGGAGLLVALGAGVAIIAGQRTGPEPPAPQPPAPAPVPVPVPVPVAAADAASRVAPPDAAPARRGGPRVENPMNVAAHGLDLVAIVPRLSALARSVAPGAKLYRLGGRPVGRDGLVHPDEGDLIIAEFIDPKAPDGWCFIDLVFSPRGLVSTKPYQHSCDETDTARRPRCSMRQVWDQAIEKVGVPPPAGATADILLYGNEWTLRANFQEGWPKVLSIPNDCSP